MRLCASCSSPGLTGSIAILGGLYLHTNPYGNLHWNSEDLLVGLACALPLILLGKQSLLHIRCLAMLSGALPDILRYHLQMLDCAGVGATSFLHSWLISHGEDH